MSKIVDYITSLCKLKKENGICASQTAVDKLAEKIKFVRTNSPFLDKALELNHRENELFGVALSSQKIDSYDKKKVTHCCRDYCNGNFDDLMVFGVDIIRVSEYITQSGQSQGLRRADLIVTDATGKIKVKVWSDLYERVIPICVEMNSIILTGKRGFGKYSEFLIAINIEQAK